MSGLSAKKLEIHGEFPRWSADALDHLAARINEDHIFGGKVSLIHLGRGNK